MLRELRLLRPILNDAVPRYHLVVSPLHYVKNPSVDDERVVRFGVGEEERLFEALRGSPNSWLAPCAEFALETACRRSEMLAAEWKHYDPAVGTIWLPVAKNGKGRHLSVPGSCAGGHAAAPSGSESATAHSFNVQESTMLRATSAGVLRTQLRSMASKDESHRASGPRSLQ